MPKEVWRRWTTAFDELFESAFYHHGLFCAINPFVVILGMSIISVSLMWPSLPLLLGSNPAKYASLQFDIWNTDEDFRFEGSPLTPMSNVPKWMDKVQPVARIFQIEAAPNEGHAMQRRVLRRMGFEFPNLLATYSTQIEDTTYTLSSFCVPLRTNGTECLMYHPGLFWGCNESHFDEDVSLSEAQTQSFLRSPVAVSEGGRESDPGILRGVILKNLRGAHGINYVSADAAVLLIAMRSPRSHREELHESEFFRRMWQHAATVGIKPAETSSSTKHTYLRYRTPSSSTAEQAYLGVVYALVFFYVYFTVARFESVKSKLGLAVAAVTIIFSSTLMAIGLCQSIGLITTVTAVEVLPFLIVAIGLDNITIITDSVVSRWGVATRFQVAEGLAVAGPQLMRSLLSMEGLMLLGVYSRIAALQEFCAIVSISLLCEFVLEITLYVSILSIDIRRVELADFFTVNGGNDTSQLLPRPDNNASPERPNSSSLTRLRGVGAVHLGFGGSLPFILSVIITIIFALIGGVSNVADRTYAHTSIPSLLVDWRAAFRGPHTPDEARPTFLFLPPLTVVLDGWRGGGVGSSTEIPIVWVSTYLEGSGSTSSLVSTMTVMFILASAALTTCWLFQVPRRLNSWVFGLYGAGAPAFNAFGETQNCEVTTFVGHEQEIECVAVVASGDYQIEPMFATACLGGEIRIWDPETARCVEVLTSGGSARPTTEDPESVAPWCLAAHESFIVAGYASGVVKVWDLSSHRVVALPPSGPLPGEGEPSVRDGGGITAVVFFENTLVTASSTGVLQQWHFKYAPRTPQRSHGCTDTPHTEPYIPRVASLRSLVDCGSDAALCSRCGSHEVMAGGQLVRSGVPFLGLRRSSNTTTFTLGDDGEVLSAGNSPERPVSAVQRAPETSVLTFHRVFSKAVHRGPITQLLATQTQLVSASQDKLIKVYSRDLQCVRTFYGHEAGITCIAVCGSTSIISGSRDKTVRDWRVSDGSCANVFSGHTDAVLSVCMSDIRAVSCSHDDTIRIWSRSTGRCTQVLRDSTMQVALHPSSVLITASDGALTAWNLLGHVERLRTVSLANDHEPTNEGGVAGTRHLAIHNGTVFCDLGSHVKAVKLPFPSTSTTKTKEP